jgi:hypothetical protein
MIDPRDNCYDREINLLRDEERHILRGYLPYRDGKRADEERLEEIAAAIRELMPFAWHARALLREAPAL